MRSLLSEELCSEGRCNDANYISALCSCPSVCIALDSVFAIPKDALLIKPSSFSYMYIYVKDTESESEQSSDHPFRTFFSESGRLSMK